MNKKINVDIDSLRILYSHYKKLTVPLFVIFISLILFVKFIIPQIQNLAILKEENKNALNKLNIMNNNLNILSSLNDLELDKNLRIVTSALPSNKDFNGILNALSFASSKTNAALGNFSLKVGDLSESKATKSKYLFMEISLNISSDIKTVNNFINALNSTLPISSATSVDLGNKTSSATIVFYYNPLPPIIYSDDLPFSVFSKKDDLIKKLSSFSNISESLAPIVSPASNTSNPF